MNAKKRSASRCTARGEPAVSRRAVVVLPAPGGPVRIRTGSPPSIAAAILERLLLAAAPAPAATCGRGIDGRGAALGAAGGCGIGGRLTAATRDTCIGGLVAHVAGGLVLNLDLALGRLDGLGGRRTRVVRAVLAAGAAAALAALVVAAAVVAASAAVRLMMAADLGGAVPGGRRAVPGGREGRLVRAAAVARRPGAVMAARAAAAMAMRRGRALVARARAPAVDVGGGLAGGRARRGDRRRAAGHLGRRDLGRLDGRRGAVMRGRVDDAGADCAADDRA